MNEIVPFNFENHQVRTVVIQGEPWFVAKDVCEILGLDTGNIARDLDADEFANSSTRGIRFPGVNRGMTMLTEPGLFSPILRSRVEAAKRFKRWVTHEVLPTIRKTGGVYMTPEKAEEILADPDLIIGLAQQVKALKEERDEAVRTKAWISDKKTASAMGTAGVATKRANRYEKKAKLSDALDKLRDEYRAFTHKGYRYCEHCGLSIEHNKPACV